MNQLLEDGQRPAAGKRRRWLLALDPVFAGGRQGKRTRAWDVEDELVAVALLGDVTVDLSQPRNAPAEIAIQAYAVFRDVDISSPKALTSSFSAACCEAACATGYQKCRMSTVTG